MCSLSKPDGNDPLAMHRAVFGDQFQTVRERFPRMGEILDYWESIRGGRAMPLRENFDPLFVPRHLSRIILIDVLNDREDGRGRFRYRVVGEEEAANRQRNPMGLLVDEAYFDHSADSAIEAYLRVCRVAGPTYLNRFFRAPDRRTIQEHAVFLPLTQEETSDQVTEIVVYSERY